MRRSWIAAVAAAAASASLIVVLRVAHRGPHATEPSPAASAPPPLAQLEPSPEETPAPEPVRRALDGLDLLHVSFESGRGVAHTAEGEAHLTLDEHLQSAATALLAIHHLPEAALVLMEVRTGRLLAYATHVEHGPQRDMCVEATAPSASVFKIVTAAALVEDAHLGPDTSLCYSGGEQRITSLDLVPDPKRDRWCATLAGAMGRSLNTVFARFADAHLTPAQLESMARRFGYGQPLAFDVPVQPSALHIPTEPLEFARTAAGFWNTTLSPLEAARLSAIVARRGESVRPRIVDDVVSKGGVVTAMPAAEGGRRVVARETAEQLATMMQHTVTEGTSRRAFHDLQGRAFLPGVSVAGKTGTLTDGEAQRFYTWFTGFAPAGTPADVDPVAVAVLVVNGPTWEVKANVIARDMLRAYFASKGHEGVTRPALAATARHRKP